MTGKSGDVVVDVTVDECGHPIAARLIKGDKVFESAVLKATMEWRFTPTKLEGRPVKVIGSITFSFNR